MAQRIFASGLATIEATWYSDEIQLAIDDLKNKKEIITTATIKRCKDELENKFKAHNATMHVATKARPISLEYRGVTFQVQVQSYLEEFELKAWAFLKQEAIRDGLLPAVGCENALCDVFAGGAVVKIDADTVANQKLAREEATRFLDGG